MIRRFLLAWRMAGQLPRQFVPVEWNEVDKRWLADVFAQYSGQKLRIILDNAVTYTNGWAVQQKAPDTIRACGFAAGVTYLLSTIDEHLPQISPQPDDNQESTNEVPDLLEYLRT